MDHLSQFFAIFQENDLTINPSKCVFTASSLKFLGHQVSAVGIVPLQCHVTAIQDFPPLTDLKGLQRLLGMVNFYRQFLPSIPKVLQPLTDLLKGNPKVLLLWFSGRRSSTLPSCSKSSHLPCCRRLRFACWWCVATATRRWLGSTHFFLQKTFANTGEIFYLRSCVVGCPFRYPLFPLRPGGQSIPLAYRP